MIEEPRNVRMPLMVSKSEASDIDDFRFNAKFFSRAEAVRHLMHCGIELPTLCERLISAIGKLEQSGTPIPESVRVARAKLAPYLPLSAPPSPPALPRLRPPNVGEFRRLSNREQEVLNLIGTGSYNELAKALGITEATFKIHVMNVKRKLGVKSIQEAKKLLSMHQRQSNAVGNDTPPN